MGDIKESDWKMFKRLRELALERFFERVMGEIASISSDGAKSNGERFGAIYRLVRERNKDIDPIFDYLRRSTAVRQIIAFRSNDLMTADELQQFSPELVRVVEDILRPMEIVKGDDFEDEDEPIPEHTDQH
jgi:hypothetical protein